MYEDLTPEGIKAKILAQLTSWSVAEGSFADTVVAGVATEIWQLYQSLNAMEPMFFIDETSGPYIDKKCAEYGIYRKESESDAALVARLYDHLRRPTTSGNANQYRKWALESEGVGFAKIFPLWAGAGTVKVLLASPSGGVVPDGTIAVVDQHIASQRPIGAAVTVEGAKPLQINIAGSVHIDGATTLESVAEKLRVAAEKYLQGLIFSSYTVTYSQLLYLLLSIEGVVDVSGVKVNGGTGNVSVGAEQIPILGTVVLTNAN